VAGADAQGSELVEREAPVRPPPEYPLDPGLENTVAWYRTQGLA